MHASRATAMRHQHVPHLVLLQARTQKNKGNLARACSAFLVLGPSPLACFFGLAATEYHLGQLKARLAKLRTQLQEARPAGSFLLLLLLLLLERCILPCHWDPQGAAGGSKGEGEGFDVKKFGDARVALIGFPSGESLSRGPAAASELLLAAACAADAIAPCSGQVDAADADDGDGIGGCGVRVHDPDRHPRHNQLQGHQDPDARSPWYHRGCRGGQGPRPAGHCLCQERRPDPYGPGCGEALDPQGDLDPRIGEHGNPPQPAAATDLLQEAQGRGYPLQQARGGAGRLRQAPRRSPLGPRGCPPHPLTLPPAGPLQLCSSNPDGREALLPDPPRVQDPQRRGAVPRGLRRRRADRRDRGEPKVRQVPLRVQQDRRHLARGGGSAGEAANVGAHVVLPAAQPRRPT